MKSGFKCDYCNHQIDVTPVGGHEDGVEIALSPINGREKVWNNSTKAPGLQYEWEPIVDEYVHIRCIIKWLVCRAPGWISNKLH